ncbi:MAG: aromatic acid exporter family protein [Clostridiaceae bacterium]
MRNWPIGMRTIKTAIVVIISYFLSTVIPNSLPFAMIYASVICVETSVVSSFKIGYNRVLGTILGGIIGLMVAYIPWYKGLTMALGIIVTILVCNYLNIKKTTGIAITLVIIILLGSDEFTPGVYAFQRTFDTILGIVIATIVNTLIYPPNQMNRVRESFIHYKKIAKQVVGDVLIYNLENGLTTMGVALEDYKSKVSELSIEIPILKKYNKEEFEYYTQMIEEAEKVYIYTETLSLLDREVRITVDNKNKLMKMLSIEIEQTNYATIENSSREDLIFNYTLVKLISAMEKIFSEKTFQIDTHFAE